MLASGILFILIPPVVRGNVIYGFKSTGKMKLIFISHSGTDIRDGKGSQLQQLRGIYHAVVYQKFLGGFSNRIMENLPEIIVANPAHGRNIPNSYVSFLYSFR